MDKNCELSKKILTIVTAISMEMVLADTIKRKDAYVLDSFHKLLYHLTNDRTNDIEIIDTFAHAQGIISYPGVKLLITNTMEEHSIRRS